MLYKNCHYHYKHKSSTQGKLKEKGVFTYIIWIHKLHLYIRFL